MQKNYLLNDLFNDNDTVFTIEQLILNFDYNSEERKLKLLNTLNKLKIRNDLKKEIWRGFGENRYDPERGYLAFVDKKGIMKFKMVLLNSKIIALEETYEVRRIITNEALLSKKRLDINNFYDKKTNLYYEDKDEAFEITSKSLFPDYILQNGIKDHSFALNWKYDEEYKLILVKFEYDYHQPFGKDYDCEVKGGLYLNPIRSFLINVASARS